MNHPGYTPTEAQMLAAWTDYSDPERVKQAETVAEFERFMGQARGNNGTDTSRVDIDQA